MAKYITTAKGDSVVYGSLDSARLAASRMTVGSTFVMPYRERDRNPPAVGRFFKFGYFSKDLRVLGAIGVWRSESTGRYRFVKRDGSLGASADDFVRPYLDAMMYGRY